MKEYIKRITYSEILKFNGGSRYKTDKFVQYYEASDKLIQVNSMTPEDTEYVVNYLTKDDLKYRSVDFEPPIGKREWIAWILLSISIAANVLIALFAK